MTIEQISFDCWLLISATGGVAFVYGLTMSTLFTTFLPKKYHGEEHWEENDS